MSEHKQLRAPAPRRFSSADAVALAGTLLVGAGAWMIYPPAGLLAVGALLLLAGVAASRKGGG